MPCATSKEHMMEDPKDPRMSGKIAMYALLALALLVVIMVVIGG